MQLMLKKLLYFRSRNQTYVLYLIKSPQTFFNDWFHGELVTGLLHSGTEGWDVSLLAICVSTGVNSLDLSNMALLKLSLIR